MVFKGPINKLAVNLANSGLFELLRAFSKAAENSESSANRLASYSDKLRALYLAILASGSSGKDFLISAICFDVNVIGGISGSGK